MRTHPCGVHRGTVWRWRNEDRGEGLKVLSKSRVRLGFLAPYPGAINSGFPVRICPGILRRDSNNNFQLTKSRRYRRRCTIRTGHCYYYNIIIALCY